MRLALVGVLVLLVTGSAEAQTLQVGDVLVETTTGWGRIRPDAGLGWIPWGPWPGVNGRLYDAEVTSSGQVWGVSYFSDPNGGPCQCAGGVGLVDPDDGSIEFLEESPGVPLVVGRHVSSEFAALLAVDEASMRVFASFASGTSVLDLSGGAVTRTPMMGSGPWKMEVLGSGSIVAGFVGQGLPQAVTASAPPFTFANLNPSLAGYPLVELRSGWLALGGPQAALMSVLFANTGATANGIFAVDTTTGAAILVLGAAPSFSYGQIVAGGGLAYARASNGITEIDLANGTSRIIHDGVGVMRLVQVVPVSVPEPSAHGSALVGAGVMALLALRRSHAHRAASAGA